MKYSPTIRFPLILAAALLAAAPLRAADQWVKYQAQPEGSKIKIEGTSTIHDWTVECNLVPGTMELDASFDSDLKTLKVQPKVEVSIPVRQLKSGKKSMDAVMQDAMKMKDHAKIDYRLLELTPKSASGNKYEFEARGVLTVSGVTRTNTMPVTLERLDKTKIKVTGVTKMKMTDHGIKPPSPEMALGLIKTGDDVKLTFEWTTIAATEAK